MLKEIHEQADAVAETIADRTVRARRRRPRRGRARRGAAARRRADRHRRLRHLVPRGPDRPLRDRGVGARPGRDGHRLRVPLPQPGRRPSATSSSASRSPARPPTRSPRCASRASAARRCSRSRTSSGSQATRDADGVLYTRAGLEIGVAATKTFVCQVAAMYLLALRLAELRGTLPPERIAELVARAQARCRTRSTSSSQTLDGADRGGRRAPRATGLLPLPRPPRRAARRARGRAQAQGDLLHRRPTPTRPAR